MNSNFDRLLHRIGMFTAVLMGSTIIAVTASAKDEANDVKSIPDTSWIWYPRCETPYTEERGLIDSKEICVLTSKCFSTGVITYDEAIVKAYCSPSNSNICPNQFAACFKDNTIKKADLAKLKYKNAPSGCQQPMYPSSVHPDESGAAR